MEAVYTNWKATALRVHGPDAADFLHRLTTTNIKRSAQGRGYRSLLLTGASHVIASFFLYRESFTSFVLIASKEEFSNLADHLAKMHFSENLERVELAMNAWIIRQSETRSEPEGPALDFVSQTRGDSTYLEWSFGRQGFGFAAEYSSTKAALKSVPTGQEKNDLDFWERLRIDVLVPRYQHEWMGEARALDIGFLRWIDREKGCYPGQEVVEKSLNLGHPAAALVKVSGLALPSALPLELESGSRPAGRLTSVARAEAGVIGLAVVKWNERQPGNKLSGSGAEFIVETEES